MIMLMSMLLGLTPTPALALEDPAKVNSPKPLPDSVASLAPQPEPADISPKAYPIEPSKTPPAVKAWTPNQELIEKRTASSRTFSGTKPGQFETRLYSDAVNFEKDGKWAEIDSTLIPVAGGKLKNKANSFGLEIADYSNAKTLAKLQLDPTHSVSFGIDQAARVKGKVAKDAVTYSKVKKFTDVRLTSQRSGLKEELILSSPDAPARFVFPLILQGLTASIETNGDVVYKDSKGDEWARTPHGFMFDSNLDPRSGESAVSTAVDYALIPHKDGVALEVSLDRGREWINSPDRKMPITVDPQIHAVRTWGDDTYVMRNFTRNNSSDPELKVGTYDGGVHIGQSYAHFDTAPLAGKQINSATLYAVEKHSWNCNVGPGPVYRVTQPWSGSAMTTFPGAPIDSNQATGGWHSGACPNRLAHWVVTPQVAQMAAEGQTGGSFSFRAPSEADNNHYKKYLSFEAGNGPYLSVEYNTAGPTGDPIGNIDESTPVAGGIRVAGWVIDPDSAASTQVHIYVGSALVGLNANMSRPDVGIAYPGYGDNHGFSAVISAAPGTHNVCFYGINIAGTPGTNPLLGGACRTITVPGASVPGAPANATATANPDGSVAVSWSPPSTNPWSPIDLYVAYSYNADNTYSGQHRVVSCTGPCTSTSFTGLPIAGQRFYIYAHNAGGFGSPAVTNTVTPKTIPSPPTNAVATAQPDGRVKVSWTLSSSNGGATMGVHVVYVFRVLSNGALEYTNRYSTPCATCTEDFFDDLTVGSTYRFYVYATNTVSHSATAAETNAVQVTAAVPTVPGVPQNPQATVDGDNVDVTWTAPAGGPAVASYRVQAHEASNDAVGPQKTCDSPCTSVEFTTGLTAGTAYKFKVYAVNSVGDSDPAVTGTVTIPEDEPVPTVPDAPGNPQATVDGDNVAVAWTAPAGGPDIASYRVQAHVASTDAAGPQKTCDSPCTSVEFTTGLTAGTPYKFKIYAVNSAGDSAPAVTSPVEIPGSVDPLVYVALGDSYSSGEGAGNSYEFDDPNYLTAYEGGTYAPEMDVPGVDGPGNGCHRALANYPKVNQDLLASEQEVVLIDVTCSGAVIENIYPNGQNGAPTQLAQMSAELVARGLTPEDVDLVTVGVGGNDGRFADIGFACVLPTMLRKLLDAHSSTPPDLEFILNRLNCARADEWFFDSDDAISEIKQRTKALHGVLGTTFPEARILQVDYPDVIPSGTVPEYCGGIARSDDLAYARSKITSINDQIRTAIIESQQEQRAVELVELEGAYSGNALCPQSGGLVVGIDEANMDVEIERLLNEGPNGDSDAKAKIDDLFEAYAAYRNCLLLDPPGVCDVEPVVSAGFSVYEHFLQQSALIMANLTQRPTYPEIEGVAQPEPLSQLNLRIDRAKGLFHPNLDGHFVQACRVLGQYMGSGPCMP